MTKFYFFIGTEAELIKVFPIIREMEIRHLPYKLIASGQNDISHSRVLLAANGGKIDLLLSDERTIRKTAGGLVEWYFKTRKNAAKAFEKKFGVRKVSDAIMIVHGDTVSTVMGAYLGKRLGMKVAHIEAGLRSHNWLNPFPEEIDRMLVSRVADYHFAPGDQATQNLAGHGNVYNTTVNTLVDSLKYALQEPCNDNKITRITDQKYFVFVLHRQENLEDNTLIQMMLEQVENAAQRYKCVLILHKITEIKLNEMGVLGKYKRNENFVLLPRVDYFDFMKLLRSAQFVITDGGSNQEELSYMGKPTLIVRKTTERSEGLGKNAVLYEGDSKRIKEFIGSYKKYNRTPMEIIVSPSVYITDILIR